MKRVAAETDITQMIDLLLARDVAEVVGVHHDMDGHGLAIETHPGVATSPAFSTGWSLPDVTGSDEAHVDFDDALQDLL